MADGDYAIAISMFEYIYTGDLFSTQATVIALNAKSKTGEIFKDEDNREFTVQEGTVKNERPRVSFRKIVWVRASNLVLGSAAQQQAIIDKKAKEEQDAIDAIIAAGGKDPRLANNDPPKSGSSIWTTLLIIFVILGISIWGLIAWLKRRKKKKEIETGGKPNQNIQIIKIPKQT